MSFKGVEFEWQLEILENKMFSDYKTLFGHMVFVSFDAKCPFLLVKTDKPCVANEH